MKNATIEIANTVYTIEKQAGQAYKVTESGKEAIEVDNLQAFLISKHGKAPMTVINASENGKTVAANVQTSTGGK